MEAVPLMLLLGSGPLLVVVVAVLTGLGARRRGAGVALAVASGLVFPVTWAVWYVRDGEHDLRAHRAGTTEA